MVYQLKVKENFDPKELVPSQELLQLFEGKFSKPQKLHLISNGKETPDEKRYVLEGAGLIGIDNFNESKQWAALIDHMLGVARGTSHFAHELGKMNYPITIEPSRFVDLPLLVHAAKRPWREATTYVEANKDWLPLPENDARLAKRMASDSNLDDGLQELIHCWVNMPLKFDNDKNLLLCLAGLASKRYAGGKICKITEHMADYIFRRCIDGKYQTPEVLQELQKDLPGILDQAMSNFKGDMEATNQVLVPLVDAKFAKYVDRKKNEYGWEYILKGYIKGRATEQFLIQHGVDPNSFTNQTEEPDWSKDMRRKYLEPIEASTKNRIMELGGGDQAQIDKEFPLDSWWGAELQKIARPVEIDTSKPKSEVLGDILDKK